MQIKNKLIVLFFGIIAISNFYAIFNKFNVWPFVVRLSMYGYVQVEDVAITKIYIEYKNQPPVDITNELSIGTPDRIVKIHYLGKDNRILNNSNDYFIPLVRSLQNSKVVDRLNYDHLPLNEIKVLMVTQFFDPTKTTLKQYNLLESDESIKICVKLMSLEKC